MRISYSQCKNEKDAFDKVKKTITADYLSRWRVDADLHYDEVLRRIKAKGPGFSLELRFSQDSCELLIEMGILLMPFKKKVSAEIISELEKVV